MSQFYPRPEAQATTWDELMLPVSSAVRDLLVRIQGAHKSIDSSSEKPDKSTNNSTQQIGNCFLVYGSRGTGKTTVLLNAQRAICRKDCEAFFKEITQKESNDSSPKEIAARKKVKADAQEKAESLSKDGLVWLDILNLESLPTEANLLTVLLTQVRNALHSHSDKRQSERRSIFEEEADSARKQLNDLINDATLRWQNITEQDTRNISSRQVKAADIYADFQKKFKKAMDKLAEELRDAHSLEKKPSIVLPIDNVDRSTDHLQSIVKLAQLVSHPNLWLVMAGDRFEVETFLERAYWKELIRGAAGTGAQGKMDSEGEDEALTMARRQANATAQKLWPTNHRIEINLLTPTETLAFAYKQNSVVTINTSEQIKELLKLKLDINVPCAEYEEHLRFRCKCYSADREETTIRYLLEKIPIPTTDKQRKYEIKKHNVTLLDLIDVTDKIKEPKDKKLYLTRAAHHGLLLPARSVVDLWQLLDWLVKDISFSENDYKAEKVARTMLRTAIAGSNMPNWMAQKLQNDILRRGENGGTVLYFGDTSLQVMPMASANHDFEGTLTPVISKSPSNYKIRSQLVIRNIEDITLWLQYNYSPTNIAKSDQHDSQHILMEKVNEKKATVELPPLAAAWLMVLYDILMLAEDSASSWVIDSDLDVELKNVSVDHEIVTQAGKFRNGNIPPLRWNIPDWELFWGQNIFGLCWKSFRKSIIQNLQKDNRQFQTLAPRLLAAGWIFFVLKTSINLISSIEPGFDFQVKSEDAQKPKIDRVITATDFYQLIIQDWTSEQKNILDVQFFSQKENDILEFENNVMRAAADFYQRIQEEKEAPKSSVKQQHYGVMIATGKWLETKFIYFLSSAYVPIDSIESKKRLETIWESLKDSALQRHWKDNLPFILAELDEKWPDFDDKKIGEAETKKDSESLAKLLFADLYCLLEPSDR